MRFYGNREPFAISSERCDVLSRLDIEIVTFTGKGIASGNIHGAAYSEWYSSRGSEEKVRNHAEVDRHAAAASSAFHLTERNNNNAYTDEQEQQLGERFVPGRTPVITSTRRENNNEEG